jgi:hypothetical protein
MKAATKENIMDPKKLGDALGESLAKVLTETFMPEMAKVVEAAVQKGMREFAATLNQQATTVNTTPAALPTKQTIFQAVLDSVPTDRYAKVDEIIGIVRADRGDYVRESTVRMYCASLCAKGLLTNRWGQGYRRTLPV